jgi:hypothetical protein
MVWTDKKILPFVEEILRSCGGKILIIENLDKKKGPEKTVVFVCTGEVAIS